MATRKSLQIIISFIMLASLLFGGTAPVVAQTANAPAPAPASMPAGPTDETKVPHYFGPFPNWANSPLTTADVAVTINGDGTGAAATATVGAGGAVTGVTITNPGSGYTAATVAFSGAGTGASADAVVNLSGVVTSITINPGAGGAGYTAPVVAITGGGAATNATATAFGGVDVVALSCCRRRLHIPNVDFDLPDDPNGIQASGHVVCDDPLAPGTPIPCPTDGSAMTLLAVVVDQSGSGYSAAPNVVIRDGTLFDPINNAGSGAMATATLTIQNIVVDTFGSGYTSAPAVDIPTS